MQLRLGRKAPTELEVARTTRRSGPATAMSLVMHAVLGVILWNALQVPAAIERYFRPPPASQQPEEKVQFVTVVPTASVLSPAPSVAPVRKGVPSAPSGPPLVAPQEIPRSIPAPARTPSTSGAPSSLNGPLAGGAGPTRGVAPTYADPRVWVGDPDIVYAPKTNEQRLDSALASTIKRKQDSIAASTYSPNKFERGDWTVDHNGQKYGIDQQYIHLGKFSIPTALLAMLPLNRLQGNPGDLERARSMNYMRSDIMYHAQAAITEAEFREAVKAVRERKEKEKKSQDQTIALHRRGDPHVVVSPGDRPPQ